MTVLAPSVIMSLYGKFSGIQQLVLLLLMLHDDYKKSDLNGIKPNQLFHLLSSIHISKGALCTIGFHQRAEKSRVTRGARGMWVTE